jgi:hypothetical protein
MGVLDVLMGANPVTSVAGSVTSGVFGVIGKVIDRMFPDPAQAAEAKLQMLRMQQEGEFKEIDSNLQLALGQMRINEAEAASGSAYSAGWRPTVGYIGCISLGWNFIGYPIANYVIAVMKLGVSPPPMLDTGPLLTIMMGMLGIGVMRTWEKGKGVAS